MSVVDEWLKAKHELSAVEAKLKAIEAQLPVMSVGDVLEGETGKIRLKDRAQLNADRLYESISLQMWTRVTKRVPVSALIKAEIIRGKIDEKAVSKCYDRTKPWIEIAR